jgi:hypothetical protein
MGATGIQNMIVLAIRGSECTIQAWITRIKVTANVHAMPRSGGRTARKHSKTILGFCLRHMDAAARCLS